jgi:TetR/AcrR family transcriptional regulator
MPVAEPAAGRRKAPAGERSRATAMRPAEWPAEAQEKPNPAKLRLLQAAASEFAERGFAGARIDMIAQKAQVNKQLIYHYFGGKQQLYGAVLTDMVRRLQLGGGARAPDDDGDAAPGRSLRSTLELYETIDQMAGRQWVRLLMFEALESGGAIHLEDARRRAYGRGLKVLAKAQESGEVDPSFDTAMLRTALFGLTLMPVLLPQIAKLITNIDPTSEAFAERWSQLLRDIYARLGTRD